jgi:hypothetical protein
MVSTLDRFFFAAKQPVPAPFAEVDWKLRWLKKLVGMTLRGHTISLFVLIITHDL